MIVWPTLVFHGIFVATLRSSFISLLNKSIAVYPACPDKSRGSKEKVAIFNFLFTVQHKTFNTQS